MYVLRTSEEKRELRYTWRRTYIYIYIYIYTSTSSKEGSREAATIPRGILNMQDKTCLANTGSTRTMY